MGKKYEGVRERVKGKRYEIYFRAYKGGKKIYRNIEAGSLVDAYYKRQEIIAKYDKAFDVPEVDRERMAADFVNVWKKLEQDLLSEKKPHKTVGRYRITFWRMFGDFRKDRFPHIQSPSQLTLPFFREYRNYYANELNRPDGIRAELTCVKAMIRRLYMLGFCSEDIIRKLKEIKKPKPNKKDYPNLSTSEIKTLLMKMKKEDICYYSPIAFIARTGRRIAETTLIQKEDVLFKGLKPIGINIKAETTKTKEKAPLMRLDSDLEAIIIQSYKKSKSKYLFSNRMGRKCSPGRVRDFLKRTAIGLFGQELGRKITPHYFRHRFFTECSKSNAPLADVKAISGIKDTKVLLEYYSHSTDEGQDQVLAITSL